MFSKIHWKITVSKFLFSRVCWPEACNFIKKVTLSEDLSEYWGSTNIQASLWKMCAVRYRRSFLKKNVCNNRDSIHGPWLVPVNLKTLFYKQLALEWLIAKHVSGLNPVWLSSNEKLHITEKWSFLFNSKRKIRKLAVKLTMHQNSAIKHYWENFKITGHKYRFWILKIIVFLAEKGYLIRLLSKH